MIERHRDYTGSTLARKILDNFDEYRPKFVKVMPHEYRRALTELAAEEAAARASGAKPATEAVVHG
ncbi:Glutamate synthase [NADPH] large chain [Minicystis rosea]|nr:Glutamate synthase [NADPH] large chain [Minicystis rosea]